MVYPLRNVRMGANRKMKECSFKWEILDYNYEPENIKHYTGKMKKCRKNGVYGINGNRYCYEHKKLLEYCRKMN